MPQVSVRLRVPLKVRGGALYNAGEVAEVERDFADRIVAGGLAEPVAAPGEEADFVETKGVAKAPRDKQVKWAPNKGGGA